MLVKCATPGAVAIIMHGKMQLITPLKSFEVQPGLEEKAKTLVEAGFLLELTPKQAKDADAEWEEKVLKPILEERGETTAKVEPKSLPEEGPEPAKAAPKAPSKKTKKKKA